MSSNPPHSQSFDALSVGRSNSDSFITYFSTRDPNSNDVNFPVQKRWFNIALDNEWILVSYTNTGGVLSANWQAVSHSSITTETLTGNSGGAVGVDGSNNINVIGDGSTINIVGVPGTHTLTASTTGSIASTYTEDSGTASPVAGNLIIAGGTGITTSGSGHTVTISATGAVAESFPTDSGTAVPLAGVLHVSGGTGINTSGATDVVTVNLTTPVASANGGTGVSSPTAHTLPVAEGSSAFTFLGPLTNGQLLIGSTGADPVAASLTAGSNITITPGAGSITIASTLAAAFTSINVQTFTTTGTYTPTAGMLYCTIEVVGGGGGGGGTSTAGAGQVALGWGGGGGGYARKTVPAATIGASKGVTIGAGGTGGSPGGANAGTAGGTTSVGVIVSATGGGGGTGSTTGSLASGSSQTSGGVGSGGDVNAYGGTSVASIGITSPAIAFTAGGGSSIFGSCGTNGGFSAGDVVGQNGVGYGGGGNGGGSMNSGSIGGTGGNGSPGIVIITEYI